MTETSRAAARPSLQPTRWRGALLLLGACLLAALLLASEPAFAGLQRVLAWGQETIGAHPVAGIAVFILLAALSAMLAFFSSAPLVPVAVYVWGEAVCVLLVWLGWVLGGVTAYSLGRWLGRPLVARLTTTERLHYYESRLSGDSPFPLVLLFQLAVPSEIPGYVLGLIRYRFRLYLAAVCLAELPYAVATVYFAQVVVDRRYLLLAMLGACAAALSAWLLHRLHRRLAG